MNQSKTIYAQLMDSIKRKIVSGELKIGDKVPSERQMADQYGISRMTVRTALKRLEDEGILVSKQGSGTFVQAMPLIEEKVELGKNEILSLSMQIRLKGMNSSRRLISLGKVKIEDKLKQYFPGEENVYEIVRLALINNDPYALQKSYLPCSLCREAERFDFENGSLYEYMADQGCRPKTMVAHLKIEPLPEIYRELLNEERGKAIFLFDYYGFTPDNKLVEYTISYQRPKYTSIKYTSIAR